MNLVLSYKENVPIYKVNNILDIIQINNLFYFITWPWYINMYIKYVLSNAFQVNDISHNKIQFKSLIFTKEN